MTKSDYQVPTDLDVTVTLLDYGCGNVQSVVNAIKKAQIFKNNSTKVNINIKFVKTPQDIEDASILVFPGVGAFGSAMESLNKNGYTQPLKQYLASNKPFFGVCIGMQCLFEASEEGKQ